MSESRQRSEQLDLPPVRRRDRSAPSIGLNLTSMIDVVFLLLVYFLVATDFKQSEEIYRLDLPERREGMALDPFELDDEPL
ncbi:MAG: biopolymer transporter ExbD, partial [Phycisphaerales bacterium]|nr:biopolymer transporter ExbD [Phycisphaerales bacterium]